MGTLAFSFTGPRAGINRQTPGRGGLLSRRPASTCSNASAELHELHNSRRFNRRRPPPTLLHPRLRRSLTSHAQPIRRHPALHATRRLGCTSRLGFEATAPQRSDGNPIPFRALGCSKAKRSNISIQS